MSSDKNIAYGHQGHSNFNKRFELTTPANDVVNRPWLSNEALDRLPSARSEFDRNRDPTIAAQLDDLEKTEAERREGQGDNSTVRKRAEKPTLELKPPRNFRQKGMWLAAQRDFVMGNRPRTSSQQANHRERARTRSEPDLSS